MSVIWIALVVILITMLFLWKSFPTVAAGASRRVPYTVHLFWGFWDPPSPLPPVVRNAVSMWKRAGVSDVKIWLPANLEPIVRKLGGGQAWDAANNIQKCDLARYALLYKREGLYSDLDCVVPPNFAFSLEASPKPVRLFLEQLVKPEFAQKQAEKFSIRKGKPEDPIRVANYCMQSTKPGEPYFLRCFRLACQRIVQKGPLPKIPHGEMWGEEAYNVIWTSGPDVTSTVYAELSPSEK